MNKFKKSQVLVLFVLLLLLVITPLLPSSLRPTHLYFIFNILIITLVVETGLLSVSSSNHLEDKNQSASSVTQKPLMMPPKVIHEKRGGSITTGGSGSAVSEHVAKKPNKVVEKSASEKVKVVCCVSKVEKCPMPTSLFFIGGGGEVEEAEVMEEKLEAEEDEIEQELFVKAEAFIGNFYRQLKMQREESWRTEISST